MQLDALVRSGSDAGEQLDPARLDPPPRYVVTTAGGRGGRWEAADGASGTWEAAPLPGPRRDAYGAGDSFAAALAYGLGDGRGIDGALRARRARRGAQAHRPRPVREPAGEPAQRRLTGARAGTGCGIPRRRWGSERPLTPPR